LGRIKKKKIRIFFIVIKIICEASL
jgi:hypothetical protein